MTGITFVWVLHSTPLTVHTSVLIQLLKIICPLNHCRQCPVGRQTIPLMENMSYVSILKEQCVRFRGIIVVSSSEECRLQPDETSPTYQAWSTSQDSFSAHCLKGFYPEPNYPQRPLPPKNEQTWWFKQVKTLNKSVSHNELVFFWHCSLQMGF